MKYSFKTTPPTHTGHDDEATVRRLLNDWEDWETDHVAELRQRMNEETNEPIDIILQNGRTVRVKLPRDAMISIKEILGIEGETKK